MRLTDEERAFIAELSASLPPNAVWAPHKRLLDRLAAEPQPPENTVPLTVWCVAYPFTDGRAGTSVNCAEAVGMVNLMVGEEDPETLFGFSHPDWAPIHKATIHVPIARPPTGENLGEVIAEAPCAD